MDIQLCQLTLPRGEEVRLSALYILFSLVMLTVVNLIAANSSSSEIFLQLTATIANRLPGPKESDSCRYCQTKENSR